MEVRLWSNGGMILRGESHRTRRNVVPVDRQVFCPSTLVFRCHLSISAPCPYLIYQPLTPFNISNFSVGTALFWVMT